MWLQGKDRREDTKGEETEGGNESGGAEKSSEVLTLSMISCAIRSPCLTICLPLGSIRGKLLALH